MILDNDKQTHINEAHNGDIPHCGGAHFVLTGLRSMPLAHFVLTGLRSMPLAHFVLTGLRSMPLGTSSRRQLQLLLNPTSNTNIRDARAVAIAIGWSARMYELSIRRGGAFKFLPDSPFLRVHSIANQQNYGQSRVSSFTVGKVMRPILPCILPSKLRKALPQVKSF